MDGKIVSENNLHVGVCHLGEQPFDSPADPSEVSSTDATIEPPAQNLQGAVTVAVAANAAVECRGDSFESLMPI